MSIAADAGRPATAVRVDDPSFLVMGTPRVDGGLELVVSGPGNAPHTLGRSSYRARTRQRGYTLIEVIVAFAILALGLTLLLGSLSGATRQVRHASDATRAALHAQSLLAQLGVGEVLQPGRRDGEFERGRYRWTLDVVPYRDPTPRPATIPGDPTTDPFGPRLLELLLTVQWGERPRDRLLVRSLRLVAPDPTAGGVL